ERQGLLTVKELSRGGGDLKAHIRIGVATKLADLVTDRAAHLADVPRGTDRPSADLGLAGRKQLQVVFRLEEPGLLAWVLGAHQSPQASHSCPLRRALCQDEGLELRGRSFGLLRGARKALGQ